MHPPSTRPRRPPLKVSLHACETSRVGGAGWGRRAWPLKTQPNKGAPNQPLRPLHTQPHGTTPRSRTTDRCSQYICVCVCDGTQVKGNPGEGVGVTKNTPAAPTAPLPPLPPRNHTGTTPRSRETQCAVGPSRRRPCLLCFIPWLAWLTPHS